MKKYVFKTNKKQKEFPLPDGKYYAKIVESEHEQGHKVVAIILYLCTGFTTQYNIDIVEPFLCCRGYHQKTKRWWSYWTSTYRGSSKISNALVG